MLLQILYVQIHGIVDIEGKPECLEVQGIVFRILLIFRIEQDKEYYSWGDDGETILRVMPVYLQQIADEIDKSGPKKALQMLYHMCNYGSEEDFDYVRFILTMFSLFTEFVVV